MFGSPVPLDCCILRWIQSKQPARRAKFTEVERENALMSVAVAPPMDSAH
jgi:hypothetical protein